LFGGVELTMMSDEEITALAKLEAEREGVALPYRLVMIRQRLHEEAGRCKEANECAAIRHCLELAAK
jgi:hypothetical protein